MKPVTESNLSVRAPGQRVAAMRDGCGLLEYRWRRAQRVILSRREPGVLRATRGLYGCVNLRQGKRPVLLATRSTPASVILRR